MGRYRELENGVILSFYVERELAEELRRIAHKNGLSLSQFLRVVLMDYLKIKKENPKDNPGNPGKKISPLRALELEEFDKELANLEIELGRLMELKKQVTDKLKLVSEYKEKKKALLAKWEQLKKKAVRIKVGEDRQARLVELYKKLLE